MASRLRRASMDLDRLFQRLRVGIQVGSELSYDPDRPRRRSLRANLAAGLWPALGRQATGRTDVIGSAVVKDGEHGSPAALMRTWTDHQVPMGGPSSNSSRGVIPAAQVSGASG